MQWPLLSGCRLGTGAIRRLISGHRCHWPVVPSTPRRSLRRTASGVGLDLDLSPGSGKLPAGLSSKPTSDTALLTGANRPSQRGRCGVPPTAAGVLCNRGTGRLILVAGIP